MRESRNESVLEPFPFLRRWSRRYLVRSSQARPPATRYVKAQGRRKSGIPSVFQCTNNGLLALGICSSSLTRGKNLPYGAKEKTICVSAGRGEPARKQRGR